MRSRINSVSTARNLALLKSFVIVFKASFVVIGAAASVLFASFSITQLACLFILHLNSIQMI